MGDAERVWDEGEMTGEPLMDSAVALGPPGSSQPAYSDSYGPDSVVSGQIDAPPDLLGQVGEAIAGLWEDDETAEPSGREEG